MHKQTNIELESEDGNHRFTVFIREHLHLLEIFSIGLVYYQDDSSSLILVRYNGDHGIHRNQLTKESFSGCHIHKFKEDAVKLGIKAENQAEKTTKYTSAREAMRFFFEDINVTNYLTYYQELQQTELFN